MRAFAASRHALAATALRRRAFSSVSPSALTTLEDAFRRENVETIQMDAGASASDISIAGLYLCGGAAAAPRHPRAILFANFKRYVASNMESASDAAAAAAKRVHSIERFEPTTIAEFTQQDEMLRAARDSANAAASALAWLREAENIPSHKPRTAMAATPTWSFAGDVLAVARSIEDLVSQTVPSGRGTKDDLPLVYVSNPPRHGKSLLLDSLFLDEATAGVCVLNSTYNATTSIDPETDLGPTATCALRGLLLRLLNDLIFDRSDWREIRGRHSPLMTAENPVQVFREMLNLDGEAPRLLICIDEVSKLVDNDSRDLCWTRNGAEKKAFWRGLFSLTRATPEWIRVVMTGFTDSPSEAVSALDVGCRPFALSMITGPEQELLAAELVWAYAVENTEPFPGLLWALTKSTPGLLGLWAQLIELHSHTQGSCLHKACQRQLSTADLHPTGVKANLGQSMRMSDLHGMEKLVPWVAVLVRNAEKNWPLIKDFLAQEDALSLKTIRAARNSDLVTMLGTKVALSPFAVAITVLALRGSPRVDITGSAIYRMLDGSLRACEAHGAGCAASMPPPYTWRYNVHEALKEARRSPATRQSAILTGDPRLQPSATPLPEPSMVMPGATVNNVGDAYDNFVLHAVALRLECLLLSTAAAAAVGSAAAAALCSFSASQLVPQAVGVLCRPLLVADSGMAARHPADANVAVAMPMADYDDFLAKLCTQTAALLLPSSVTMILNGVHIETVSPTHFMPSVDLSRESLPDVASIRFAFSSVGIAADADCPVVFPVVALGLQSKPVGALLCQKLVAALSAAASANEHFDTAAFVAAACTAHSPEVDDSLARFVDQVVADVGMVVTLAERAALTRQVILFKPGEGNPLCDICAIIPCATEGSVFFLWFVVRDRIVADFTSKLRMANVSEFIVAPVAERLKHCHVSVEGALLIPVSRSSFRM